MNEGYVKLYRKLMHNVVWQDPLKLKLWLFCLMKASYKKREVLIDNQIVQLDSGQFVTGRDSIEREFNRDMQKKYQVSGRTLWRWMKLLESEQYISINSTNKFSIITINNWDVYNKNDQQMSEKHPATGHQMSTNKKEKNLKKVNKKIGRKQSNLSLLDDILEQRKLRKDEES